MIEQIDDCPSTGGYIKNSRLRKVTELVEDSQNQSVTVSQSLFFLS